MNKENAETAWRLILKQGGECQRTDHSLAISKAADSKLVYPDNIPMIIQDEIDFFSNLKSTYFTSRLYECKSACTRLSQETEIFDGIHIAHTISIIEWLMGETLFIEALSQERPL